eukprot:EG_transcript_54641
MFPHAKLFWRDAFFNLLEPAAEGLLAVLRNRTNKYFKAAGFIMISGHDLNSGIPPRGTDSIHPLDAVYDVISNGVKYSLCHVHLAQNHRSEAARMRPTHSVHPSPLAPNWSAFACGFPSPF